MHKTYITFGFDHVHEINGQTFDKDCVAVLTTEGPEEGRELAFGLFGRLFCFEYPEAYWTEDKMRYFPKGYVIVELDNKETNNKEA